MSEIAQKQETRLMKELRNLKNYGGKVLAKDFSNKYAGFMLRDYRASRGISKKKLKRLLNHVRRGE